MYRATADIDIVADIRIDKVHPLFEALRTDFYVDEQVIRDAVVQRSSFNAIHFESVFKVDIVRPWILTICAPGPKSLALLICWKKLLSLCVKIPTNED